MEKNRRWFLEQFVYQSSNFLYFRFEIRSISLREWLIFSQCSPKRWAIYVSYWPFNMGPQISWQWAQCQCQNPALCSELFYYLPETNSHRTWKWKVGNVGKMPFPTLSFGLFSGCELLVVGIMKPPAHPFKAPIGKAKAKFLLVQQGYP